MAFWNGGAPGFAFLGLSHVEYFLGTTESKLPFFHISSHSLKVAVMISDAAFFSNKLTYPVREVSIQRKRKHLFILACFLLLLLQSLFVCCFIFSLLLTLMLGNSQRPLHFYPPAPTRTSACIGLSPVFLVLLLWPSELSQHFGNWLLVLSSLL